MKSKLLSKIEIEKIIIPEEILNLKDTDEGKISIINFVIEQMVNSYEFQINNEEEDNFVSEQFKLIEKEVANCEGGVIQLVRDQLKLEEIDQEKENSITEDEAYYLLTEKIIEQYRATIIAQVYCEEKGVSFNEVTYRKVLGDLSIQMGVNEEEAEEVYPLEIYMVTSPMVKLVNDIVSSVLVNDSN